MLPSQELNIDQAGCKENHLLSQTSFELAPKAFWRAEMISQFFFNLNSSKSITCPSDKLRTEFTTRKAKSTRAIGHYFLCNYFEWTINKIFSETVLYCMLTFALDSATFSWLLLFITKYRASSKKSSTSTLFFCLDDALATLLLMWRLSVDELSLSSLEWVPSMGDVAFLFLLFTLGFFCCSLSSASLRFSIKRKSQLLLIIAIAFIKIIPLLFVISFNLTPSFVINAKIVFVRKKTKQNKTKKKKTQTNTVVPLTTFVAISGVVWNP